MLDTIFESCGAPTLVATTPTLIEQAVALDGVTIQQSNFLGMRLRCSAPASVVSDTPLTLRLFYNYSSQPATIEIRTPQPSEIASRSVAEIQSEGGYTLNPGQRLNMTRNDTISLNNTLAGARFHHLSHSSSAAAEFKPALITNKTRVYNSTGHLWASDDNSAGAPHSLTIQTPDIIVYDTETIPGTTAVNETIQEEYLNALRDNETLLVNTSTVKRWLINITSVFTSSVHTSNVTAITNYSAYGITSDAQVAFTVNVTNQTSTFNLTSESVIDDTTKTIRLPSQHLSSFSAEVTAADDVPSAITLNFPANATNATVTSHNFTWTATDNLNDTLLCNLTINSIVNSSSIFTANATPTNLTVSSFIDGTHHWNVTCFDGINTNTSETRTFVVDTKGPALDNRTEDPISGVGYSGGRVYNFTINITDELNAVNNVTLVFNNITHVATKINNRYNVTITDLPAGTHNYSWIANDTLGNVNTTPTFQFVVNQAASTVNLTLNGTQNNITIFQGGAINITANLTNGSTSTLEFLINNQAYTSGTSPLSNLTNFSNTGTFNITARHNATQNFSSTNVTHTVSVQDATPPGITLNFPDNNITTTNTSINFTWTAINAEGTLTCNLTINGTTNQSNV
ncbi:MAG: hypothetical protein AABY13_00440, partial [Nanoarchaeota archaeon]